MTVPGPYRVAEAATWCVEQATTAAAELLRMRGTDPGPVSVDPAHALASFRSERYLRLNGAPMGDLWSPLSGDYRAADGWVRLHCNYPHHEAAVLEVLGGPTKTEIANEVALRSAAEVAEAVLAAGGAAACLRSADDWRRHPQGQSVAAEPLMAIERIGDAPARPLPRADRPLAGVRVLDLTHVIAGPACGRVLAAHGADVLHVGAAHLPTVFPLVIDHGFGKRTCHVDLREEGATLRGLLSEADLMVQSFRPDTFAAKGFGPADLPPGTILVSLSAYGHSGPWRARRGFDSLVQLSTGIAQDAGDRLVPLPAQALDHATGWLAATAVMTALRRRAQEGGTWHVRVSLARTARWLDDLGRIESREAPGFELPYLSEMDSDFGLVRHVRFPGTLPGSPPGYGHGPRTPGSDPAAWW
ncbi:CoA transferase [Actinokineospora sp. HUAS TT18]|uniref:CoA transferase n=1 Tax=Actinokineospora sp. HUAS TT18 TaxID=3447451 RepID=UPI003F5245F3